MAPVIKRPEEVADLHEDPWPRSHAGASSTYSARHRRIIHHTVHMIHIRTPVSGVGQAQ